MSTPAEHTEQVAHSLAQAFVPGAPPQVLAEVVRADRAAHEQAATLDRLSLVMDATAKRLEQALKELALGRRQDRHRRLFGHPLARVFILGNQLVVVHLQGGAA